MIEKLIKDSYYGYIDDDGCAWKSKKDFLQISILDFCGCGNGDEVMIYVKNYLEEIKSAKWDRTLDDLSYTFFLYWADHKEFIEHGTTVRCSWLTPKGKELLNDINWCLKNECNDLG